MRLVLFCHSLQSDWNHGNAHFLRGICRELLTRGHEVAVWEPRTAWSREHLRALEGEAAAQAWRETYPDLSSSDYDAGAPDLDRMLDGADLVIAHEWSDPRLIALLSAHRKNHGAYRLLFLDTHHRAATAPEEMARFDLSGFDGVLAFGEVLRRIYERRGFRAWTWHEAADTTVFHPIAAPKEGDLVWIGNWGDGERTRELHEFLLGPARRLDLAATVHGVRYPAEGLRALALAGISFRGYLPNHRVPDVFARHRVTVHIPRAPYAAALPGIPTIRVFEALACGVPLISAPWEDEEKLFRPGEDFLIARSGAEMERCLNLVLRDRARAHALAESGLSLIRARHTCGHRVDELLRIAKVLEHPACEAA
jgi:spore maturation protein CgeB